MNNNNMKFSNKKLLILGTNVGSVDFIEYARRHGAYTIVADYLPSEKSLAKQHCDESVLISTADTERLCSLIKEENINGVFAGVSEFNLLQAMKLCEMCGLPFYCNMEQWESIENKAKFRALCKKFHVPTPKTLFVGKSKSEFDTFPYPVVVKPVDASASRGVSICNNVDECAEAVEIAKKVSNSGNVIIEEFFEGEEFSAHYSIANGKSKLVCLDNRYPISVNQGAVTTIPVARVYPSTFLREYENQVNDKVIDLCNSLCLKVGVLFVQGLYNKDTHKFCVFEAGLRSAGEAPYRIINAINGINYMDPLIDYSLSGDTSNYDIDKNDPKLKGKSCAIISFVSKGGRINKITGVEEIVQMLPKIIYVESRYKEGDITPCGNTLNQIVLRFVLICDTQAQLKENICLINQNVHVLGDDGTDICLVFDANKLM